MKKTELSKRKQFEQHMEKKGYDLDLYSYSWKGPMKGKGDIEDEFHMVLKLDTYDEKKNTLFSI